MSTSVSQVIVELNNATNDVAARISALVAQLTPGTTIDQAQIDQLTAIAARLETLAADPANPVPAT